MNKVMRNYFKAKLSCTDRIMMDDTIMKLASSNSQNKFVRSYITSCQEWPAYQGIFGSMKLTGILIETFPNAVTTTDSENPMVMPGTYMICYKPVDAGTSLTAISDTTNAIVLSTNQNQRKYVNLHGGPTGWFDINLIEQNLSGQIATQYNNLIQNGGMVWTVRFTFYITFKNPK
jgi:hypothetical protein